MIMNSIKFSFNPRIFVESQKETRFLGVPEIEAALSDCKSEEEDLKINLAQLLAAQGQATDPEKEDLAELQAEMHGVQRKIEQTSTLAGYLREYRDIIEGITEVCPSLEQLLGSKNVADVQETIQLITMLYRYDIQASKVPKTLDLNYF